MFNNALDIEVKDNDLKSVFRIGKNSQSDSTDRNVNNVSNKSSRPILVQFRDKSLKNQVMESLSKLKNADDAFRAVSITHDMTLSERETCKKLVLECKDKQKEEKGEFVWRVRGSPGQLKLLRLKKL